MNSSELELLEKWESDPGFINWVNNDNAADVAKWDSYFEANPHHIELAEIAKFSFELKSKPVLRDKEKSMAALSELKSKIAAHPIKSSPKIRALFPFKAWQVAASLLLLVACGWGYSIFFGVGEQIVITTQEEQKELNLADGSRIILNEHSTFKYFENDVRNVELIGEAYFEVNKKPATGASFQVKTEDLLVTVLGTEFNVNSGNGLTSVYLDGGKVKLNLGENSTQEIEMLPGDLVSYSKKQNKVIESRKAKSLEKTAWKEKVILFEEAPITKVLETISLVYGVKFDTNISVTNDQQFTGGIPVNDLDICLQTLKDVYQLEIKKIEEKFIIEKSN